MNRLFEAYRAVHEQAYVPIFCRDNFDSRKQVEAAVAAGCKAIEYTLRKADAREMIPWVRKNYPDLFVLVGSVIDSEKVIRCMKRKFPQLMTLQEIVDFDIDGFVSMLGWSQESLRRYSPTHVIAPTAMTVGEGLAQTDAGAQFQKLSADMVTKFRGEAAFSYCPIMVTGGQTPEAMPATFASGAVVVGTGLEVVLKGIDPKGAAKDMAPAIVTYLKAAKDARHKAWPDLAKADGGPKEAWLNALPHYHPFGKA
jgi:2-keto-3-deoxy-6-phosphogluconate aldolase